MQKNNKQTEFECNFCKKSFIKESSLAAHCCVKKMRWLDRDSEHSQMGFYAYKRFYQLTGLQKKDLSFKTFMESTLYNDFLFAGKWINEGSLINPKDYIDYLIKSSFKIKDWTKDSVYENYLRRYLINEKIIDGIERTIKYIEDFSNENDIEIKDFFEKISTNKAVDALRNGRISPWIFFISNNSNLLIDRFDESQYKLMGNLLNAGVWSLRVKKHTKEIKEFKAMIADLGL